MPEPLLELVAVGDLAAAIRHGGGLRGDGLDDDLEPPPPADLVLGRVHEDPVHPGIEPIHLAELRELPPASDERLLDGVLGEVGVAQDQPGDRVEVVDLARGELPECLAVA